jgi:hypothetical protein
VTRQAGYGLFVGPDQVDAAQFEHLLGWAERRWMLVSRSAPRACSLRR